MLKNMYFGLESKYPCHPLLPIGQFDSRILSVTHVFYLSFQSAEDEIQNDESDTFVLTEVKTTRNAFEVFICL